MSYNDRISMRMIEAEAKGSREIRTNPLESAWSRLTIFLPALIEYSDLGGGIIPNPSQRKTSPTYAKRPGGRGPHTISNHNEIRASIPNSSMEGQAYDALPCPRSVHAHGVFLRGVSSAIAREEPSSL